MKNLIIEIFDQEFSETILSISEITGLGSVNRVFEIHGRRGEYIIRLNTNEKKLEYQKENWCISKIRDLGIPTPKVLSFGLVKNISFMVQEKVKGINGVKCNRTKRKEIWRNLGKYAKIFQQVKRIEENEVEENEFHKNWKSCLEYNIAELNEEDSLVKKKIFSITEHTKIRMALSSIASIDFKVGLVHGDLCPRNVIINDDIIYLLDWGTAEINVVPHTEIGILLLSEEASKVDINYFLKGLGLPPNKYMAIEHELKILNLLHRLDKYRWAEGHGISSIEGYTEKIKKAFDQINKKY
ncbi:MAG TPA: aminoglycoside phosphotransferase family protein [Rhodothermales bacterium]|nr:aminoglycoside phosphotransferase family protein [Rhodothermales bacterium]